MDVDKGSYGDGSPAFLYKLVLAVWLLQLAHVKNGTKAALAFSDSSEPIPVVEDFRRWNRRIMDNNPDFLSRTSKPSVTALV